MIIKNKISGFWLVILSRSNLCATDRCQELITKQASVIALANNVEKLISFQAAIIKKILHQYALKSSWPTLTLQDSLFMLQHESLLKSVEVNCVLRAEII